MKGITNAASAWMRRSGDVKGITNAASAWMRRSGRSPIVLLLAPVINYFLIRLKAKLKASQNGQIRQGRRLHQKV